MAKYKKIIKKKTEKLLIETFLQRFKLVASRNEKLNKRFSFVLTGGPSPINLYNQMSKLKINWKNIDFFWGDERFVSKNSKNSNYQLVYKHLIKKIKISKKQIYLINTKKKSVQESAKDYQKKLNLYFNNKKIIFDLVLLGMGNDGHIASIFSNDIENQQKNTKFVIKKDFKRITLTLNTINNSKNIYLWLNSKRKARIFNYFLNKKKNVPAIYLKKNITNIYKII